MNLRYHNSDHTAYLSHVKVQITASRKPIWVVLVYEITEHPMMLATNISLTSKDDVIRIAKRYFSRWRIEEYFRCEKTVFDFESFRVRSLTAINALNFYITVCMAYLAFVSIKKLTKIPFMNKFVGILTHEHETALYHFGTDHTECNVHLIRYLTANSENTGHKWSGKMISLLCEANRYRKRMMKDGRREIPRETLLRLETRFDELLIFARHERKQYPARFRWATQEETSLLNRLKKYKQNHLLFLHDFRVPFDNNMSERDLRKCKNRQKMAGGFRTAHGLDIFCSLLSITETCKRQTINLLLAFRSLFARLPLFA